MRFYSGLSLSELKRTSQIEIEQLVLGMKKIKAEEELRDFTNAIAPKLKKESIDKKLEYLRGQLVGAKEEVIEIKSFEGLAKFL